MAKKQNIQFTVKIPLGISPVAREKIADKVIDYVRDRTKKGRDKDEAGFEPYTSYGKKPDKITGKSNSSPVNLRLTGDMLDTLSLVKHSDGQLTIGYEEGDEIAKKVFQEDDILSLINIYFLIKLKTCWSM